jgi:hypothetical protein
MLNMTETLPKAKGQAVSNTSNLTDDERRALQGLSDVLTEFIELRPNMPMHQVVIMLQVALDEGKSLKHYSQATEFPTSTVSRAFLDNGPKMRTGEEGLGLIEARTSIASLREYETHLTTKGRTLFRNVARKLLGKR